MMTTSSNTLFYSALAEYQTLKAGYLAVFFEKEFRKFTQWMEISCSCIITRAGK